MVATVEFVLSVMLHSGSGPTLGPWKPSDDISQLPDQTFRTLHLPLRLSLSSLNPQAIMQQLTSRPLTEVARPLRCRSEVHVAQILQVLLR